MFAKLILLISLIFCLVAHAEEPTYQSSGFIYNTWWSDHAFQDNRTVVAVNGSIEQGPFAARIQVNNSASGVRRATLEYSESLWDASETVFSAGRFGRVESFYNNILDTPSSSQMAVLPFAGYSYRMFNGSFVLMDGINIVHKEKLDGDNLLTFRYNYGRMVIDDQEDLQKEAFKQYNPQLELHPRGDSSDYSLKWDTKYSSIYASKMVYKAKLETTLYTPLNNFIANKYHDTTYELDRFGIKLNYGDFFGSTEYTKGNTDVVAYNGTLTSNTKAADVNYILGSYIGNYTVYLGESIGKNKSSSYRNTDHFAGITYNYNRMLTVSVDRHIGNGLSWAKYDTALQGEYSWNTWVVSTTLKFQ